MVKRVIHNQQKRYSGLENQASTAQTAVWGGGGGQRRAVFGGGGGLCDYYNHS